MKKRLTGAIVLVALAVIFVPMMLDDKDAIRDAGVEREIPVEPVATFREDMIPDSRQDAIDSNQGLTEQERRYELPVGEEQGSPESSMPVAEANVTTIPPASTQQSPTHVEKPKTVTDPSPAAPSGKGWVVQAGSFGQSANAEKLVNQLKKGGRTAFIEKIDVSGKTLYRVRVGPMESREAADKELAAIEKEFNLKGKVISYP